MQLVAGTTVGIDLGTSFSTLARLDDAGNPVVVNNSVGSPVTSSIILLGRDRRVSVGPTPEMMIEQPENTIVAIKRQMGNGEFFRVYEGKKLTPEFLSAMILRKLKQDAERVIGPIGNAVITVPYYFNDPCRQATVQAGRIAGLNVIDVINEPTAATLTYAWTIGEMGLPTAAGRPPRKILVYDLGGGTFDVTVVTYTPTSFRVEATDGDTFLGGLDWTRRLVNFAAEQFQQRFKMDPRDDAHSRVALTEACEIVKEDLTKRMRTTVDVAHRGLELQVTVTRNDFERLTADLLQRTRDTTELVMELAKVGAGDLDEILLVGGSTYMPMVHQMLEELTHRQPSTALDPRIAVAQGAAVHAAILEARATGGRSRLSDAVRNRLGVVKSTDVNSHSLGVEITDHSMPGRKRNHVMIPKNSPLPARVAQRFVTDSPNPQGIRIRLLEGEASDVNACTRVGDFRIKDLPPNLPAGSPVEVAYSYDARRRIVVSARELTGNAEASVDIKWEGALDTVTIDAFQALADTYEID
jgi:molecular chaperone DnaK